MLSFECILWFESYFGDGVEGLCEIVRRSPLALVCAFAAKCRFWLRNDLQRTVCNYLRKGSAQKIVCAATLSQKLQIKLAIQSQNTDTWPASSDAVTPGA